MLTNIEVARIVESFGYGKLPSGCTFKMLGRDFREEIVIASDSPTSRIYYLRSDDNGSLEEFKYM